MKASCLDILFVLLAVFSLILLLHQQLCICEHLDCSEKFKKGERHGNAAEHEKLRFLAFLGSLDCLVFVFFFHKEEKLLAKIELIHFVGIPIFSFMSK